MASALPPLGLGPEVLVVLNNGNASVTLTASVSSASPAGWTAKSGPGQDQFGLRVGNGFVQPPFSLDLSSGPQVFNATGTGTPPWLPLYSGYTQWFGLQLKTPRSITKGNGVMQTICVTITAAQY